MMAIISLRPFGSSMAVGSSNIMQAGFMATTPAMAILLFLSSRKQVRRLSSEFSHIHIAEGFIYSAADFFRFHSKVLRSKGDVIFNDGRNQLVIGVLKYHAGRLPYVPDVIVVGSIKSIYVYDAFRRQKQSVEVLCRGGFSPEPFFPLISP